MNYINYGKQYIDSDDIDAVVKVLQSDMLTQGPDDVRFESAMCNYVGARYATAVNSGTSALHIACLAAGITSGDEVITSPITFVASANCAIYCGGIPVFADINPQTYNISPEEINRKITHKTKAVIPVHFAGQSCDMVSINKIVKDAEKKYGHKIHIIEDASHALGSVFKNQKVGSCFFSDMTVMSFHPVKHITTGEGGIVFTNSKDIFKKLSRFRSHGITSEPDEFICKELAFKPNDKTQTEGYLPNPWYYEQQFLGYNFRMTNIQSALGISQLKKLELFRKRRREIVDKYNQVFKDTEFVQTPFEEQKNKANFHLYVLLFDFKNIGIDRARFIISLREQGFYTQVHYIPVHLQHYFRINFGTGWGDCEKAETYYQKCLSIPLYPGMTDSDVDKTIRVIKEMIHQ